MIGPYFIDWTNYRTRLEQEASLVLGQPVKVDGDVTVRILPLPRLSFSKITVGQNPDGTPMMTARKFSVDAELMPFLSGQVRIIDMRLDEPDITVQVNESGAISWTMRKGLIVGPQNIKLDNLEVRDARVRITGLAGGRQLSGDTINAHLRAQSLVGPWRIEADGRIEGVDTAVEISTGRAQDSGSLRVKVQARRAGLPYRLSGDGGISLEDGLLTWRGVFEILASGEAMGSLPAETAEPLPIHVGGKFVATPNGVDVDEYRLEIGPREDPYTITGTGKATIREEVRFLVKADGRQIDLDRLAGKPQGQETVNSLDRRIAALRNVVDRIPIPAARGRIDFVLPAIVAGDTAIREVTAIAEPDGDRWRIHGLKAILPGNTSVEADGTLSVGEAFGFSGRATLASRQPTGFATWLTGNSNAALRGIGSAGFSADVTLTTSQAAFENLQLAVGDATLRGRLLRLAGKDGRPGIVAALAGDRIDLGDLLAIYALTQSSGDEAGLSNHDLDIDLRAGEFRGLGLVAKSVDANFRIESGEITVNRLKAGDFYGVSIDSAGRLTDLLGAPSGSFRLKAAGANAAALAELAGRYLPGSAILTRLAGDAALSAPFEASVEIEARAQQKSSRGTVLISGKAAGTQFDLRDRFEGSVDEWRQTHHDAALRLDQPSPLVLARQLALPVAPIDPDGPISLTADIAGRLADKLNVQFGANTPQADLSVEGNVALPDADSNRADYAFAVTFGSRDVDPWLLLAGYPLPDTGQGNPVSLSLQVSSQDRLVAFSGVSGNYSGNGFSGDLSLLIGEGRPKFTGKLAFDRVSAGFLGELVLGAGSIESFGVDAVGPFAAPVVNGIDIDTQLSAGQVVIGGQSPGTNFSAQLNLSDNTLALNDLAVKLYGGTLSGNLSVRNNAGVGVFGGQLSLVDAELAQLGEIAGYPGLVEGRGDISANFDATAQSLDRTLGAISGNGVVTARDVAIIGVTAGGMPTILAASGDENFEIKPETIEPLARRAFAAGRLAVAQYSGAMAITGGVASLRNIQTPTDGGTVSGDLQYDLASGEAQANLTVALDPGAAAVTGGEPAATLHVRGSAGSGSVEIDTTALEGYLSLRAFEREQARVETLQEQVLEKQRLRHDVLLSKARVAARASEKTDELHQLQQLQQKQDAERPPEIQRDTRVPDRHEPVNPPAKAGKVAAGQAQQDSTQANGQADGQTVDLFREIEKKVLGR